MITPVPVPVPVMCICPCTGSTWKDVSNHTPFYLLYVCPYMQDKLKDKLGTMHMRAQLLLQLERTAEAEQLYRQLLSINPDDYRVHEGLHLCLGIKPPADGQSWQQQQAAAAGGASPNSSSSSSVWSPHSGKKRRVLQAYSDGERQRLSELYQQLCESYPKSMACHRIPLDFLVS